MLRHKALKTGLFAAAILGITLASCSKDESVKKVRRSAEYALKAADNTTNGRVLVVEASDTSFNITVLLNNSTKDVQYFFGVYEGNSTATTLKKAWDLGTVTSLTTGAPVLARLNGIDTLDQGAGKIQKFNYDNFIQFQSFARVSVTGSLGQDSAVGVANLGASAK